MHVCHCTDTEGSRQLLGDLSRCCTLEASWPKDFQVMLLAPSHLNFGVPGYQMHTATSDFLLIIFYLGSGD